MTLKLDVYSPSGDPVDEPARRSSGCTAAASAPVAGPRREIVDEATTFAKKGYVNVSISYRLSAGGCSADAPTSSCVQSIIDAMHDAQAAVRFLRANAVDLRRRRRSHRHRRNLGRRDHRAERRLQPR